MKNSPPTTAKSLVPETKSRDARLAAELVANLRPRKDIAAAYGYTEKQLVKRCKSDKGFLQILTETREIWESDDHVKERVRKKAAMLVEDGLLDIYSIMTDAAVTANVRVSSFESLAKVADVAAPTKDGGGGAFKVVINLPNKEEPVTIGAVIDQEGG